MKYITLSPIENTMIEVEANSISEVVQFVVNPPVSFYYESETEAN